MHECPETRLTCLRGLGCRQGYTPLTQVRLGTCSARSARLGVEVLRLRQFNDFGPQRIQYGHGEGKTVGAAVDAINQHAFRHIDSVGLELERQVAVRHLAPFAQVLNQRLGACLVKIACFQASTECIVFDASMLKPSKGFKRHALNLMHVYKPRPFTASQVRHVLSVCIRGQS